MGEISSTRLVIAPALATLLLFTLAGCTPINPSESLIDGSNHLSLKYHAQSPVSYAGYKLFKTDVEEKLMPVVDSLDEEVGVEVWSCRKDGRSSMYQFDLLTPPTAEKEVRQVFSEYNLHYQEVIGDLQNAINLEGAEDEFFAWNRPAHPMTWEKYHSLDDMNQYLDYLAAQYPMLVTVQEIGRSFENRSIRMAKVSSGPNKPAIFVDGGMHAREWISLSTAMYILHHLVEFSWEEPQLLDAFDWYIVPAANPDGYEYSRHHDRLWRKTRSVNPETPYCAGVDANRNFGYQWMTGGSSDQPCSNTYAGSEAFSEPETRAIRDFLMKHRNEIKVYLTLHAYSQLLMLPYSYTGVVKPANYPDILEASLAAVEAIKNATGYQYKAGGTVELLYEASGTSGDYAFSLGIPYSFNVELRDKGRFGFILPKAEIEPTGREMFQAVKAMAHVVHQKLQPKPL